MISKRSIVIGITIVLLGLMAAGVAGSFRDGASATVMARAGTISRVVVATGRVEPVTEVVLANKIPGRIKAVLVREGDRVTVGQPLILFEDREYRAQLRMAEAKVASMKADVARARRARESARARWTDVKSKARPQELERAHAELSEAVQRSVNADRERARFKRLVDDGHIARAQYDGAAMEAEVARARKRAAEEALSLLRAGPKAETVAAAWAQVAEAEAELARAKSLVAQAEAEVAYVHTLLNTTTVDSTIDGKVTKKIVEPGEAVDVGMPLMVLADVRTTIVKAEVDETDVGKLAVGQTAEIMSDAYPGRKFPARVFEIGQSVGKRRIRPEDPVKIQDMKVLETKLEVIDGGAEMKLGMSVDVRIVTPPQHAGVLVPRSIVPPGAREASVQVVSTRGLERRQVTLGLRDDSNVEVLSGLSAGDQVVPCDGGSRLFARGPSHC